MKINKIQIRNFRIHESLTVEFMTDCTLITGLNESGKSTLFEAIHCALFMKHRKTGALHDAIRRRDADFPEVELWFEAGKKSWHLKKRFAGSSAKSSCSLSDGAQGSYTGDGAENALANLVRFDLADPSDSTRDALRGNASHLWVWQGSSGEDPADDLARRHDAIVERLRAAGVAGIMQSQLDARIAGLFEQQRSALLTERQQPKAGTDLARVSQAVTDLRESVQLQQRTVNRLEQAAQEHDASVAQHDEALRELERLRSELRELDARATLAAGIEGQLAAVETSKEQAESHRDRLNATEEDIEAHRAKLSATERALQPGTAAAAELRACRSTVTRERAETRAAQTRASLVRQSRERQRELAEEWEKLTGLEQELAQAEARVNTEKSLVDRLTPLISSLSGLPVIDRKTANRIAKLEQARFVASTNLNAASARITVNSASCPILVDGAPLGPGDEQLISTSAKIVIGNVAELTLRAGGGSLVDLRAELEEADAELEHALSEVQAASTEHAEQIAAEREKLTDLQNSLERQLDALRAENGRSLNEIQADITPAAARVKALCQSLHSEPDAAALLTHPASVAAAKQATHAYRKSASEAEAVDRQLQREVERLNASYETLSAELEAQEDANKDANHAVSTIQGALEQLLRAEGTDADREQRRAEVAAKLLNLNSDRKALRAKLGELDPKWVAREIKRINAVVDSNRKRVDDARESLTRTKTLLLSDGSSDPRQKLSELEGQLASHEAQLQVLQDRCDAIELLDKLFRDARENVGAVLSGALAARVDPYLREVLGAGTGLVVSRTERGAYALCLKRASGAIEDFETLSGGTKEQVATAVRLATAELLAANFDGKLPLVFDDAFVNSDSERIKQVARMLFCAIERGVQVIIGSCQPGDYKDLPAVRIELKRPAPQQLARDPKPL